jgi:hypothetical protein
MSESDKDDQSTDNKTVMIDRVRLTHSEAAGLEDALAVVMDMQRECLEAMTYIEGRSRALADILRKLREGPNAYDPDRAAGNRITIPRRL